MAKNTTINMQKTTFKISKMDCPSEEHMIRMKLADLNNINSLDFDIPNRQLTVFHTDSYEQIFQRLDNLKFDTSIIDSISTDNFTTTTDNVARERKLLWQVLFINFFFFSLELSTGFISKSMGLVADSLDMLADSVVYGLALFAVGGTIVAEGIYCKLQQNWPDFVFEKDYDLPSLSAVEDFINENKHLPNVPSATDIRISEISLGDMNATLLRKIEELTLYIIEQDKRIEKLENKKE